jgi:hypothetical protein
MDMTTKLSKKADALAQAQVGFEDVSQEEQEEIMKALMGTVILEKHPTISKKSPEYLNVPLYVRGIVTSPQYMTEDGMTLSPAAWRVVGEDGEFVWLKTFSVNAQAMANALINALGDKLWKTTIPFMFTIQPSTKHEGREYLAVEVIH